MIDDRDQFKASLKEAAKEPITQATPDEIRNGWDDAGLTAYLAEQKAANNIRLNPHSAMRGDRRPKAANSRYQIFRWQR